MVLNLASEVEWLSSELEGEADMGRVAVMGHSMGGAAVINLAAVLSSRFPGLIKAVVAIAPWNGATPTPSEVVGQQDAPLLLFCTMQDHICPCQGPAFRNFSNRVTRWAANNLFLRVLFPAYTGGIAWKGGVEAIYRNARPQRGGAATNSTASKILIRVADVGHLTIAGAGTGEQMRGLSSRYSSAWGSLAGALSDPSEPGGEQNPAEEAIIPTWGFSMAFLNGVLGVPGVPAGLPPQVEGESVEDVLQGLVEAAVADPGVSSVSSNIAGGAEEWAGL
jgi:pimeloyl-ACP methyl ester carboxylesterase